MKVPPPGGDTGTPPSKPAPARKRRRGKPAPGKTPTNSIVSVITRVANQYGVPPALALAVAEQESGLDPTAQGDGGTSFGLFQLHQGGELGSHSAQWAYNPVNNARTAISIIAKVYHANPGMDWGSIAAAAQRPADRAGYASAVNGIVAGYHSSGQTSDTYFSGRVSHSAGSAGASAANDPSLAPGKPQSISDYLSDPTIQSQYGYLSAYLKDPQVGPILARAAKNGWSSDRLLGALEHTRWWKTTAATARQWQATKRTDPATAHQQMRQEAQTIGALAESMGFQIDPARVARIADTALGQNWNDQQLRQAVGAEFKYNPKADYTGTAQTDIEQLRNYANSYLVPISNQTLQQWTSQALEGRRSIDDFKGYVSEQAKSLFPQLAKMIDSGQTVQQIADPYRQLAGQTLEINPDAVDFTQPKWRKALDQINPDSGQRQVMTLTDWQTELMKNPVYGYDHTSGAQQQAADLSSKLLTAMGAG